MGSWNRWLQSQLVGCLSPVESAAACLNSHTRQVCILATAFELDTCKEPLWGCIHESATIICYPEVHKTKNCKRRRLSLLRRCACEGPSQEPQLPPTVQTHARALDSKGYIYLWVERERLFFFPCGPAVQLWLIQGVSPPSPQHGWDALQRPLPPWLREKGVRPATLKQQMMTQGVRCAIDISHRLTFI